MISDYKAFIKDNKETLSKIFKELYDIELNKIFFMPAGHERDVQIEFVKFLSDWLCKIAVFSKPEILEKKDLI